MGSSYYWRHRPHCGRCDDIHVGFRTREFT